jgi:hypothetical protein
VCQGLAAALARYGIPEEVLTDNGKQFTGRFGKPRPAEVVHDQRGAHQISVDRVALRASTGLDLHKDAQLVMYGVDLVGDPLTALVAEEHGPPDLLGAVLATLDVEAEFEHPWPQMGQDLVAGQALYRRRVDHRPGCRYHSQELVNPVGCRVRLG